MPVFLQLLIYTLLLFLGFGENPDTFEVLISSFCIFESGRLLLLSLHFPFAWRVDYELFRLRLTYDLSRKKISKRYPSVRCVWYRSVSILS